MGFLDSLGKTFKSLGGAAVAPYGLVLDLATMPFDNKDDDFGSVLTAVAHAGKQLADPFTNETVPTGKLFGGTMHALDVAYRNAVDEPLSAGLIMFGHAGQQRSISSFFKGEDWARAYDVAQNQSAGQSALAASMATGAGLGAVGLLGGGLLKLNGQDVADPLSGDTYGQLRDASNSSAIDAAALGLDLGISWYADPGVLAGKLGMTLRSRSLGKMRNLDRVDFGEKLTKQTGIGTRDWGGRVDSYYKYISGDNSLKRSLNAAEIYSATPELQRAANGKAFAALMSDALKLPTPVEQQNALRRIMAVGAGDVTQIDRLREESTAASTIADALKNIGDGSTAKLQLQALSDDLRFDPEFNAEFNRQLDNLDSDGDITRFVKDWRAKIAQRQDFNTRLAGDAGQLDYIPGKHGVVGNHNLRVEAGTSIGKRISNFQDDALRAAKEMATRDTYSSVFQKSLYHVPLVVAYPLAGAASLYTKGVPKAIGALRHVNFMGQANLHDWSGATDQLDAMMRLSYVDDATRAAELSKAYAASSEIDKLSAIQRVERVAHDGLAKRMSQRLGKDIPSSFIDEIVNRGQALRGEAQATTEGGRIYSAAQAPESVARDLTAGLDEAIDQPGKWRADQILDDQGVPIAVPVASSQLGNKVNLFDVHLARKLTSDQVWLERFGDIAHAWEKEALEYRAYLAQAANAGARGVSTVLQKAITGKRKTLDTLVEIGSTMTRWWKYSVLTRLGYPMRVVADDHMRIAAQMHWAPFAFRNTTEGAMNLAYNRIPFYGRSREASRALDHMRLQRAELRTYFGREPHTDQEWSQLQGAIKTFYAKGADAKAREAARATMQRLDPDGRIAEYQDTLNQVQALAGSERARKAAITRWSRQLEDPSLSAAQKTSLRAKIDAANGRIVEHSQARATLLEQLGEDPADLRKQMLDLTRQIQKGKKSLKGAKRTIGDKPVRLDKDVVAEAAYGGPGAAYRNAASSAEHYDVLVTDGEEATYNRLTSGAFRTVAATEPGHTHVWANVLNHQFQHSPELMAWVRGKVSTPEEFAAWVREPEQAYLRNRMRHFAADPEEWGSRLQQMYYDYIPSEALRQAVADGPVTARQLDRLFPDVTARPAVHGQLVNTNTGRLLATRMMSDGFNRLFRLLSESPTDSLSRHPFFNAMYRKALQDGYEARKMMRAKAGQGFTEADLRELERMARIKALGHLKRTLWDVSAHSHAAHAMRFISPFFAAHQEALTRWWRLASDDPSIIRRFQLAFDAPRKMGLTYDNSTGEVKPGEGISVNHQILLRVPFAKENSAINQWVKSLGGGKFWHVNENGFNLILQNGILNPGVGPVVVVPAEEMVNRYADRPEIEKAVRILNPYPPDTPLQAVLPAWSRRAQALISGKGNAEWNRYYSQNLADNIIAWRQAHGETANPTRGQMEQLAQDAAHDTNRDLVLMMMSNLTSPAPAKPNSKYAVVQMGVQKIFAQMRQEGHDFDWVREQVKAKYGDIYNALLYSKTNNQAGLKSTYAEARAMTQYKGILSRTDPSLTMMIVGPEAAMDAEADPELGRFSDAVRRMQARMKVSPHSTDTYISAKDPDEGALKNMVNDGWDKYHQLVNWLNYQAEQQGLKSYEDSPELTAMKRAGLKYLTDSNFAFADSWNNWSGGGDFDAKLDSMRKIASYGPLVNDPKRQDVYWLGQYLALRDAVTAQLEARGARGLPHTAEAASNADLVEAFYQGVQYIRQQNTYFDTYDYHGILERDPLLLARE